MLEVDIAVDTPAIDFASALMLELSMLIWELSFQSTQAVFLVRNTPSKQKAVAGSSVQLSSHKAVSINISRNGVPVRSSNWHDY